MDKEEGAEKEEKAGEEKQEEVKEEQPRTHGKGKKAYYAVRQAMFERMKVKSLAVLNWS